VQFVSASDGWVVGSDKILHTGDGGQHWKVQFRANRHASLRTVDFADATHGWVVGAKQILATTDGGAHWRSLPEPCPAVRDVRFLNSLDGFAVAGGPMPNPAQAPYAAGPQSGGVLLRTTDGGVHWSRMPAPRDVQTACFSNPARGWLGAGGNIYGTENSGRTWTLAVHGPKTRGSHALAQVECSGSGAAWAQVNGPGAGLGHVPQIGYHTDGRSWRPIFAEQYFPHPGVRVSAEAPSVYPGPFSVISQSQAAFVGWCPVCAAPAGSRAIGPAPLDMALDGGGTMVHRGMIAGLTEATGAAFLTTRDGWVVGIRQGHSVTSLIMHTADGGRTWQAQYSAGSGR
jgi:photosystem II stability/assembly factor-like uncharacterized protein